MPVILELGMLKQEDCHRFEVILSFIVHSRLAWTTE